MQTRYADFTPQIKYIPQRISQQEGGRQGLTEEPCQLEAVEGLPSLHSTAH